MSKAETSVNLLKACAVLTYKINMLSMPSYENEWRKLSVISNSKKKELEDYRKNRCVITTR